MSHISLVRACTVIVLAMATQLASAADEHTTPASSRHVTLAADDQVTWSSKQVPPQQVMW